MPSHASICLITLTRRAAPWQVVLLRRQLASQPATAATEAHDTEAHDGSCKRTKRMTPGSPTHPQSSPPQLQPLIAVPQPPTAPDSTAPPISATIPPEPATVTAPTPTPAPAPAPSLEPADASFGVDAPLPSPVAAPPDERTPSPPPAPAPPPPTEAVPTPAEATPRAAPADTAENDDAGSLAAAAPAPTPVSVRRPSPVAAPSTSRVFVSCTGFSATERRALQRATAAVGANYSGDLTDLTTHLVAPSAAAQVRLHSAP